MYSGIVNGKSKDDIERELRRIGKHDKLTKLSISTLRRVQDDNPVSFVVLISKSAFIYKANLIINETLREDEAKEKSKLLDSMLSDTSKPFFQASWHADSADDHKGWQGLLYYDENATGEALDYARLHGLRTVQWVTGAPVWFVTRPYCRHYFVQYSLDEVMRGVKAPKHKIGGKHESYYEDRFKTLKALYKIHPTPLLKEKLVMAAKHSG